MQIKSSPIRTQFVETHPKFHMKTNQVVLNIGSSAMLLRLLSKKWLYWDINRHTEKNWDLSSVVRNMHSLIEHLNKNTPKKSLDFIVMPIAYAKCICHDAVLTFPCAWVTIKRKRKKISYFCVRPMNDNSIFFPVLPDLLNFENPKFSKNYLFICNIWKNRFW